MYNAIEIGKELMKTKVMANFSHYSKGKLFYKVTIEAGTFQFQLSTVEDGPTIKTNDPHDGAPLDEIKTLVLSSDLGDTTFNAEIRGSELFRWIKKAIANEEFVPTR